MRTLFFATTFLAAFLASACSLDPPVGFYDTTRLVAESKAAKDAFAGAEQASAKKKAEADRAVAEFQEAAKSPIATDDLQKRRAQVQQLVNTVNAELQKAKEEAGAKIDARASVISGRLAVAHRMRFVIAIAGKPAYAEPGCDLTAEIVAELDGLTPEVARARAAAAQAQAHAEQLNNEATAAASAAMSAQVVQR